MTTLNRDLILRFMRKALGQIGEEEPRYSELMCKTLGLLIGAGLHTQRRDNLHDEFCSLRIREPNKLLITLTEAYQQLLTLGYIIPKPATPNSPNPDWFLVTEAGRQWAAGEEPVPEDAAGYIHVVETLVPDLDSVIMQYVQESLIAYDRRAFFASAVMLGAASEKIVYLLIDALSKSVQNATEKAAIGNVMERRRLPAIFERISKNLERAKSANLLPWSVHEGADRHLLSLQEMIRVQCNDAVHPSTARVTPETVRLSLSAFPAACRKAYDLIEWLKNNPI